MMSKKIFSLIGVVLLLLVAYSASAWYCGKSYQEQSQQDLQKINRLLNQAVSNNSNLAGVQFHISELDYKRGIFSSQAHYQLSVASQEGTVPVIAHIQHGPFIGLYPARYQASYELENAPQTNVLFKLTEGKSPLVVTVRESFTHAVKLTATMPPINYSQGATQTVFSGLKIDADTDRDFGFIKGDLKMDHFSMQQGVDKFTMDKTRSDFDLTYNGNYFVGESSADIDAITYGGMLDVLVSKIKLESDSKDTGKLNASDVELDIGNIQVNKQDFGSFKWGTKFDNFDMIAYQKLAGILQQGYSASAQEDMDNSLRALLAAKPVLTISPLEWKTAAGTSNATLNLHFKAPEGAAKPSDLQWQDWVESAGLKADLSKAMLLDVTGKVMQIGGMDAATATDQARQMLDKTFRSPLESGLMKEDSKSYTADIRYENSLFNVNGKSMTWEEFQQLNRPSADEPIASGEEPAPDSVIQ